jgi:hypothetical protein
LPPSSYQPWQQERATPKPHTYRWLVPSLTAAGGLVAGLVIGGAWGGGTTAGPRPEVTVTATPVAAAPQGYHDPAILERDLKGILAKRLANPSGQYYDAGVTVKSLTCVETSHTAATCLWKLSDGTSGTDEVAISADGSRFITK